MFLPTAPTKCQIDGSRDKMGMGVVPKKKKPYYFFLTIVTLTKKL